MKIDEILKLLNDNNRLRILNILYNSDKEKICVCNIESTLNLSQANTSKHLNKLKKTELIISEKRAQWTDYKINYEFLENHKFIKILIEEELNSEIFKEDLEKLK